MGRITPQEEKEFKDKICNFITEYKNKNGEAPTYKEIADGIQQSKQRVYVKISKMISEGTLSEDDIRKERNRLKTKTVPNAVADKKVTASRKESAEERKKRLEARTKREVQYRAIREANNDEKIWDREERTNTESVNKDKSVYDSSIAYKEDIQIKCNNMSEVLNLLSKMLNDKVMKANNSLVNAVNISVNKLRQAKAIYFVIHNGYINISSKENKEIKVTESKDFCL